MNIRARDKDREFCEVTKIKLSRNVKISTGNLNLHFVFAVPVVVAALLLVPVVVFAASAFGTASSVVVVVATFVAVAACIASVAFPF